MAGSLEVNPTNFGMRPIRARKAFGGQRHETTRCCNLVAVLKQEPALIRSRKDPRAFTEFYSAHVDQLTGFLIRRVFDVDVALELMGETFAQAYLSRGRFRGTTEAEAKAWLYTIASRQTALFFRRAKSEQKALSRLGLEPPAASDAEAEELLHRAEMHDLRSMVRDALETVSPEQRDALALRIVSELPYAEVAAELEISEPAARARVARGLKALSEILTPYAHVEEA